MDRSQRAEPRQRSLPLGNGGSAKTVLLPLGTPPLGHWPLATGYWRGGPLLESGGVASALHGYFRAAIVRDPRVPLAGSSVAPQRAT